jgi:fatty-acyl-CoA synthase
MAGLDPAIHVDGLCEIAAERVTNGNTCMPGGTPGRDGIHKMTREDAAMSHASYVSGTSTVPLIGETIGAHFDRAVARWGAREGLVVRHQDVHWTYRELADRVDALAGGLLALGLEPGDRIGIWSPNRAEWVQLQFASAKAGLILVNINPAYRLSELEHALTLSGCKALVTANRFKSSDYLGMLRELAPELATAEPGRLRAKRLPDLRILIHLDPVEQPGMLKFSDVPERGGPAERARLAELAGRLQFDEPINIQFTSGTTGLPKGATLTHHNILNNGFFVAEAMGLKESDRLCIPVPLYHCFGMVMSVLACMSHGATMVFPCEGFDPLAVLETIEAERCTLVHGVPTMFIAEMEHPDFAKFDLSSLRAGIMAGSPCPIEVMRRVIDQMHLSEVTIAYGMTETSPVSFQSAIDDPIERRVSTVGRIHPHLEVKIIDGEGRVVPRGTPGEILTRGYSVMLGYWNDAARTAEAVDAAGWMHTGDLGVIDEAGYCNIVGRIKDLVIRGGENIYPREIEEFLFRHPKIEAAQVFGVPDDRFGEELCVWIKLRAGESLDAEGVKAFCQGQIAHYKIPRYVQFVEEFPMTVTGKIQKFIMREQMMKQLNLVQRKSA